MDYNYNSAAQASHYAAPPYYPPSSAADHTTPPPYYPPSAAAASHSTPPAYYPPSAASSHSTPPSYYPNPNTPQPVASNAYSAYQYQPAASSAVSGYNYQPPTSSAAAEGYQYTSSAKEGYQYQHATSSAAADYQYQSAKSSAVMGYQYNSATSSAAVGYQYPSATSSASKGPGPKHFGRTPAAANPRNRPGLGFKEHDLAEKKLKMMQGGAKSDSVRVCSACNVVCNSDKVFETHITSAKHIAKVSGTPVSGLGGIIGSNPKKKKKKAQTLNSVPKIAQPVYCEICKISCNDLEMYNKHVAGKKHNKNIKNANISFTSTNNTSTGSAKLIQFVPASNTSDNNNNTNISNNNFSETRNIAQNSIQKIVQSVYCDVCKITCDTQEVFNIHLTGKKHNKKVTSQIMAAAARAAATNNNNSNLNINNNVNNENNDNYNNEGNENGKENKMQNNKRKVATKEELEAKKRKMIENGTNLECVKVCEMCNVVCSSQMVFDLHVKGKMHLSMLKNLEDNHEIEAPKLEEKQEIAAPKLEEKEENLAPKLDGNQENVAPLAD